MIYVFYSKNRASNVIVFDSVKFIQESGLDSIGIIYLTNEDQQKGFLRCCKNYSPSEKEYVLKKLKIRNGIVFVNVEEHQGIDFDISDDRIGSVEWNISKEGNCDFINPIWLGVSRVKRGKSRGDDGMDLGGM